MTETASPPAQPLEIRGRPRPVKRFSKRTLMVLLGTGSAIVLGSLAFALQSPKDDAGGPARELYNTGHNPTADGLAALPKSYGEIAPEDDVLGPPLPGDLGTPILKAQREGRMGLPEQDAWGVFPGWCECGFEDNRCERCGGGGAIFVEISGLVGICSV